jgi:hypothetical protein
LMLEVEILCKNKSNGTYSLNQLEVSDLEDNLDHDDIGF